VGTKYCVAVTSGTAALVTAVAALGAAHVPRKDGFTNDQAQFNPTGVFRNIRGGALPRQAWRAERRLSRAALTSWH
jgi:hypothetical protein